MSNWSIDGGSDFIDCLLKCSGAPYEHLLSGPHINDGGLQISGWDNVKPNAEYDLTTAALFAGNKSAETAAARRPRRRQTSSRSVRGAVSMPSLWSYKFARKPQQSESRAQSYMSGRLDENFSYVYTEGLSDRCAADTYCDACAIQQQRKSVSTYNLTLDPTLMSTHPAQAESRSHYDEYSKFLAMKFRPETHEEQLPTEKSYRTLDTDNLFPSLRIDGSGGGVHKSELQKNETENFGTKVAPLMNEKSQLHSPSHRFKLKRMPKHKPSSWFSTASSTQDLKQLSCITDLKSNHSHSNQKRTTTKFSNNVSGATATNSGNRQSDLLLGVGLGRGKSDSKHKTNEVISLPRLKLEKNGKSKVEAEKFGKSVNNRIVAYFSEEGIILRVKNSRDRLHDDGRILQPAGHSRSEEQNSTMIPYFTMVRSFEEEEAVIAKRFNYCRVTSFQQQSQAKTYYEQ